MENIINFTAVRIFQSVDLQCLIKANFILIDAFWLITFTTLVTNESKLHDQFIDWAKTVKFNNKVGSRNL